MSSSVVIIMSGNNEAAPPHAGFTCNNVNCCNTFRTERGLRQHLWRSDACRRYMSLPRPLVADSVNITCESTWRRRLGYGVESSRLNPFMSADPPSYESYFSSSMNDKDWGEVIRWVLPEAKVDFLLKDLKKKEDILAKLATLPNSWTTYYIPCMEQTLPVIPTTAV